MPNQQVEPYSGVPAVLSDAGVTIAEQDGARVILIPDEVRKKANVLLPVQTVAQAVDLVRPSIRAVQLDPAIDSKSKGGVHFYQQKGGRLAPTKQALETLAFTAGILLSRTRPMSRAELSAYPEGTIGYEATVGIRRPDGTVHEITASKVWQPEVEWRTIQRQTSNVNDREERWLQERSFAPAKTESKAVLRAIRSALQIPHTFSPADAAKPFVVVGYDLALDYTDPAVVALLLERGKATTAEVYGPPSRGEADGESGPEAAASSAEKPTPPGTDDAAKAGADASSDEPPPAAFIGEEPPEPEADPEPAAAAYVLGEEFTRYVGRSVADVAAANDKDYLEFLQNGATDPALRDAAAEALKGMS